MIDTIRKCGYILDRSARRRAVEILIMMGVGAAFEALGVGLILPFMAVLTNPDAVFNQPLLNQAYTSLEFASPERFLLAASLGLVGLYVLKNGYLALLAYVQNRFIYDEQVSLGRRLFNLYLRSPYSFHVRRNTAEVINTLTTEVDRLFTGVALPVFMVLIEGLVTLAIIGVLLVVSPMATVVAFAVVGGTVGIFYLVFRTSLKLAGRRRMHFSQGRFKWINEGLGSLKEIKVFGREQFFSDRYVEISREYARAARVYQTINAMPRLLIELVAVGGLLLAVSVVLSRGGNPPDLVPLLALFAMAAIRIMPSMSRVFTAVSTIRFYLPSVTRLHADLVHLSSVADVTNTRDRRFNHHDEPIFQHAVELIDVCFTYEGSATPALHKVSLRIERGSNVAFVGRSGAGKTTLADLLLGLLEPQSGEILLDGNPLRDCIGRWRHRLGYVPQTIYVLDDTVRRNVAFGIPDEQISDDRVWESLERAQLAERIRRLPGGLDEAVGDRGLRLSGGERQRIGIARALYTRPDMLVLDEATASLDVETEKEIIRIIHALAGPVTVINVTHRLHTINACERIFLMENGNITLYDGFIAFMADNRQLIVEMNDAALA